LYGDGECVYSELLVYERNAWSATWKQTNDEGKQSGGLSDGVGAQDRIIWAKTPLMTKLGRCVAVRRRGTRLWVGIAATPAVGWVPAEEVLTEAEAARWASTGF
jgi:hypothetical protein